MTNCEACLDNSCDRDHTDPAQAIRKVLIGSRIVRLCEGHAQMALEHHVADVETLRAMVRVNGERRSPVERRSPIDRRIFPPRPEGRRHSSVRRQDDD
jgi:hypothetical protein